MSDNLNHLGDYAALINNLSPQQINFLPLNFWGDAEKMPPVKYEQLGINIRKAIDLIDKKIEINVRYIPFCFMTGYEKYVVGTYQHIYDERDWNIIAYNVDRLPSGPLSIEDYFKRAHEKRITSYHKYKKCFDCKYFFICDGIEKQLKGIQETYPILGEKIIDVLSFRQ
ncbi:MAG: hypothetical protein A2504_07015 [Bdellovibrionales bacterium RIFOXYD12_FULL_39_22]|nr:MAG: hypothetical protein A2385_05230 [Bdellovibrionales bacterium RIFOXYB1_FULL_39_21]OFZ44325.1 MAG: hypothetical protein A2485_16010 [Bdellovibrionales bacterium RIFOXYC12_FULL_39_17]OFZ49180.1 MAG: hypothetical protein A2404_15950 [Bdellovibrionales bacterium RIFOXYC1_FULL_39_130]OFZ76988.1 MAG: hypothetical protein A2560_11035 [Bdellovibrionales bacterium RIFOXYD1_FULL_39_84]OFZ95201.1 MAG: hypothetical protein A2504_07015 [Bdellovibrionales bacterium RIFOXYD12_FULL_39_22]